MAFLIAVHPFIRKNANLLFVFALAGIYGISDRIPDKTVLSKSDKYLRVVFSLYHILFFMSTIIDIFPI